MDAAEVYNTVVSTIGLFITLKVAWDVREIRKSYLRRARLPEILAQLGKHRVDISQLLGDVARNAHDIRDKLVPEIFSFYRVLFTLKLPTEIPRPATQPAQA